MVTEWHLRRLPVRITGQARPFTVVEHVVVSWSEGKVQGFILRSRPFQVLYVPASRVLVTETGLQIADRSAVERKTRHWRRMHTTPEAHWRARDVVDSGGRFLGQAKDLVIDDRGLTLSQLVVSRGLLGDLLYGALEFPIAWARWDPSGQIKILCSGHA